MTGTVRVGVKMDIMAVGMESCVVVDKVSIGRGNNLANKGGCGEIKRCMWKAEDDISILDKTISTTMLAAHNNTIITIYHLLMTRQHLRFPLPTLHRHFLLPHLAPLPHSLTLP